MSGLFLRNLLLLGLLALPAAAQPPGPTLVLHGGAGTITRQNMNAAQEKAYRQVLEQALHTGHRKLLEGGTAPEAVEATLRVLEDSPLFNAGRGAVFTHEGKNELDAAIMDGRTLRAGAVAGVTTIRNPITAARAVMEHSEHVLLTGRGAEAFARQQGLTLVPPAYFYTESRWQGLQQALKAEKARPDTPRKPKPPRPASRAIDGIFTEGRKFGTVGCVALDRYGNLAAGTSTGGMTNKRYGRVGDTPLIGAGTYADNATCAVSATGHGEYFIRSVVAYDIAALMAYRHLSVQQAAEEVVLKKLVERGGEGGVIALDAKGNIAMPFNSAGMYRGYIRPDGQWKVEIYKDQ